MDRFAAMSVFVAVAEAGSLSAAARQLRMPLPTVSRRISELEEHLETRLLNRSTRRLTLTDAGKTYLEACRRIIRDVSEAERSAAGEYSAPRGELIVTAPIVLGRLHILPIVAEFLKTYADVDVRLMLSDRVLDLLGDNVDLAVRIGDLPDSSMMATRVGTIRTVVCASPAYLAEQGTPATPEELIAHDCITFAGVMSTETWRFTSGTEPGVPVLSRLIVNTAEAAVDAAIAGVGLTRVLSYQVADAINAGTLEIVLERFEPPPVPVSLVCTERRLLPAKVRAFLDFAAPRLRARLSRRKRCGAGAESA